MVLDFFLDLTRELEPKRILNVVLQRKWERITKKIHTTFGIISGSIRWGWYGCWDGPTDGGWPG